MLRLPTRATLLVSLSASIGAQAHPPIPSTATGGSPTETTNTGQAGTDRTGGPRRTSKPARLVVRAADRDRDGQVSAEEWAAFVSQCRSDADGSLERDHLRARVLVCMVDQDGDDALTLDDLFMLFEAVDANADFVIQAAEIEGLGGRSTGRNVRPTPGPRPADLYMASLPLRISDTDGDGELSEEEWGQFVDGVELDDAGHVTHRERARWMDVAQANPEGGFSPGSLLRWISEGLDADADGRLDTGDLGLLHAHLDGDRNGHIDATELQFSIARMYGQSPGDRDRPPLMPWQRNLEDALALVRSSGRPLLICVNMDGEVASDTFAYTRYRDPAFVELARGFVPLLVSPDRHDARDFDDRGLRVPDAKFGRVTSGEHIHLGAELQERYLDGRNVAPRHLAISPSGEVLFDIFLVNDLRLVDAALREHGRPAPPAADPATMSEAQLLASPDAGHRSALEARFLAGDEVTRARLAQLALSSTRATQHPQVLHLALRDEAPAVRRQAAWSLAQHPGGAPLEQVPAALAAVRDQPAAESALLAALGQHARDAADSVRAASARELERVLVGLRSSSASVDPARWRRALSWAEPAGARRPGSASPGADWSERLAALEAVQAPEDPEHLLALAATALALAGNHMRDGDLPELLLRDALAAAQRAGELAPDDGRGPALASRAAQGLGEAGVALGLAERALPRLLPWAGSTLAAHTLELLFEARLSAIEEAQEDGRAWPAAWLADACALQEVLLAHPHGSADGTLALVHWLDERGLTHEQGPLLRRALERFPLSGGLHAGLRAHLLRDAGALALREAYRSISRAAADPNAMAWYEAQALLAAAERQVENRERGAALESYRESLARARGSVGSHSDADGAAARSAGRALAGIARLHIADERLDLASSALREGIRLNASGIWDRDGLGHSARDTASLLHVKLLDAGRKDEAERLRAFLAENGVRLEG